MIDRNRGVVRHATYTEWESVPLGEPLHASVGLPVVVDNDVKALVAAEQWFGSGRDAADFLVVSLGRGVDLGLVLLRPGEDGRPSLTARP